jgi:RIO-like serine/threonine protein kinase
MQLSTFSKIDGKPSMVVDYFPVKNSTKFMFKVLKFQGVDTMSYKCITKRDFEREMNERIGMGWEVTALNTEEKNVNPMAGAV